MSATEVAILTPATPITEEDRALIKQTICAEATEQEMKLFFYDCQRRGVHPLDKLIHFTKRGNPKKYTPITSIDFMRQRAQASGAYAGEDEPVYTTLASGAVDTCRYTVYRFVQGERCKWTATARWDEYYPGDQLGFLWKKMPYVMITKCAEALVLRKAFPAELQGLYVKEEMDQAGPEHKPSVKPSDILKRVEHGSVLEPTVQEYERDLPKSEKYHQEIIVKPAQRLADAIEGKARVDSSTHSTQEALVTPPPASAGEQPAGAADDPSFEQKHAAFIWKIGKDHKDESITTIPSGYLDWFVKNGKREDHVEAAVLELDRRRGQGTLA